MLRVIEGGSSEPTAKSMIKLEVVECLDARTFSILKRLNAMATDQMFVGEYWQKIFQHARESVLETVPEHMDAEDVLYETLLRDFRKEPATS